MVSSYSFFSVVASITSIVGTVPYLHSIIKGKTRPSAASWWSWAILAGIALFSSKAGGAPWQVLLLPAWLCLLQLTVALLSLRFGDNTWDRFNKISIIGAFASIILWILTGNPFIALGLTIVADLFASIPNFRHVAENPKQENRLGWSIGWLSGVFELFAIENWDFASSGWALYFFLNMSIVMYFLLRKSAVPKA